MRATALAVQRRRVVGRRALERPGQEKADEPCLEMSLARAFQERRCVEESSEGAGLHVGRA